MHVGKKLSAFIHKELKDPDSRNVETHLRKCNTCWQEYKEILSGSEFAAKIKAIAPPGDVWKHIEADIKKLNSATKQPVVSKKIHWGRLPRFAAGIAVAAVLIMSWWVVDQGFMQMTPEIALNTFLEIIESSDTNNAFSIAINSLKDFQSSNRQEAFEIAGIAHVGDDLPLENSSLVTQRIRKIKKTEVAELVYSRPDGEFAVFVAPESIDFSFGNRQVKDTRIEEIPCREVESAKTQTYWFGAGGFHCVLVSELQSESENATIIRYFVNAHNTLKK